MAARSRLHRRPRPLSAGPLRRALRTASLALALATAAHAQQLQTLPNSVGRLAGTEPETQTQYVRLFLTSHPQPNHPIDLFQPTLTTECSQAPNQKPRLDLYLNFANVADPAFYPPWQHPTAVDAVRPVNEHVVLTLSFLGYTKFKPIRAHFEAVRHPLGQFHYIPATIGSLNRYDPTFFLQVLRALPTLQVTDGEHTASFATAPLLAQFGQEPLCSNFRF